MRLVSLMIHQALAKPSTSSGADDSTLKNTASVPTKLNRNRQEQKHLIKSLWCTLKQNTTSEAKKLLAKRKLKSAPERVESVPHSPAFQTKPRRIITGLFV